MISIIVPVYNTELYLSQCVDSILGQTMKEIEILLVDDGSTDSSGVICDEYSKKDGRIKALHQCNQGRVCARKNGLKHAAGEYVLFIDSDDWIETDMCARMAHLAFRYDVDLVTSGFVYEGSEGAGKTTDAFPEGLYASDRLLKEVILNSMIYKETDQLGILFCMCTKLYRRAIALDVIDSIPETLRRGEDFVFNHLYLMKCKSLYISKDVHYHYRYYEGSTVTAPCPDFISQIGMTHMVLQKACTEIQEEIREELFRRMNTRILLNFIRLWNAEENQPLHIPCFCFDYGKLGNGRIVLYGAGKVGIDYFMQLTKTAPGRLALWVDKNHKKYHSLEYPVAPVENIRSVSFGQILIAVKSEKLALEIQNELSKKFQIQRDKILWQQPGCYWI